MLKTSFPKQIHPSQLDSLKSKAESFAIKISELTGTKKLSAFKRNDYLSIGLGYSGHTDLIKSANSRAHAETAESLTLFNNEPLRSNIIAVFASKLANVDSGLITQAARLMAETEAIMANVHPTVKIPVNTDQVKELITTQSDLLQNAQNQFGQQIAYRSSNKLKFKNVYQANTQVTFSAFQDHVDRVADLSKTIIKLTGRTTGKICPCILSNVKSVTIWETVTYGVSGNEYTAESVIHNLTKELKKLASKPNINSKELSSISELRRQIETFSRFHESEKFQLTSPPSIDVIVKVAFADDRGEKRLRLTQGGLFLEPKIREDGTYDKINHVIHRAKGENYKYDDIEPFNYYLAKKANLYRLKDIEKMRQEKQ